MWAPIKMLSVYSLQILCLMFLGIPFSLVKIDNNNSIVMIPLFGNQYTVLRETESMQLKATIAF